MAEEVGERRCEHKVITAQPDGTKGCVQMLPLTNQNEREGLNETLFWLYGGKQALRCGL
ncbi:hypothetical protein [Pantoea deleyi]|uniref:hypothetical protein n=1 Tax=Pantoea deleyi TaxID=470932 RepID=UPI00130206E5|nr:hypothetical protein [Pantoea deleyi]